MPIKVGRANFNGAALSQVLNAPDGMVGRELQIIGEAARRRARDTAPIWKEPRYPGQNPDRIRFRHEVGRVRSNPPRISVFNTAPHARYVHFGTQPYITSRGPQSMIFSGYGRKQGRIIKTRLVLGQEPNPWMAAAMNSVLRALPEVNLQRPLQE